MSLYPKSPVDLLVDRERLKGKIYFWKYAFFLMILLGLLFLFVRQSFVHSDYIMRFPIQGVIVDDLKQQEALSALGSDPHIKAIILDINSPGGTTTGAEALYETVRKLAETKPVVAILGTMATSGGYAVALSADHIVARGNTLTGSVGVIIQWQDISQALKKVGIRTHTVASSTIKGQPNIFEDTNKEALASIKDALDSSYDWFLGLVQQRRQFSVEKAKEISDGRIYTGWQAKKNGLIDEIGAQDTALIWLQKTKNVDPNLPVKMWEAPKSIFASLGLSSIVSPGLGDLLTFIVKKPSSSHQGRPVPQAL